MAQITVEQLTALMEENKQLRERLEEVIKDKGKAAEASAEGSANRSKLRPFRGVKFSGRREDFEQWRYAYEAAKVLDTNNFKGWNPEQRQAYLVSAVEGKALDVVRAIITRHKGAVSYDDVWKALETAFRDTTEGERALAKLQQLTQKGDLETYIQEFNTLEGLAAQVAVLDGKAKLRYFVQGLQLNLRIGVAAATVQTTEETQRIARAMNVVLAGKEQSAPRTSDPMDTSEGRRVERCWWCGIPGHVEANCKNKTNGKPRKAQIGQESRQGKLVCYKCGKPGHIWKDCKVKFVKKGMAVDNKEDSEYLPVQGEGTKDGQSENAEALSALSNHRVLEDVGVCVPAPLSPKPEPVEKAAFVLENGTETKLVDVLSAGARAITVKSIFWGKKVNILVDTGCDIVCISSRIAPRSE
jgi:hypothetical protein